MATSHEVSAAVQVDLRTLKILNQEKSEKDKMYMYLRCLFCLCSFNLCCISLLTVPRLQLKHISLSIKEDNFDTERQLRVAFETPEPQSV